MDFNAAIDPTSPVPTLTSSHAAPPAMAERATVSHGGATRNWTVSVAATVSILMSPGTSVLCAPQRLAPSTGNSSTSSVSAFAASADAEERLRREWTAHLNSLARSGVDKRLVTAVRKQWEMLCAIPDRRVPAPQSSPMPSGAILMAWDRNEHHFDVEVFASGDAEWFYTNRKSRSALSHDTTVDALPSGEFGRLMKTFLLA